eukprot:4230895-Pyramimonas_sp.AAC.1
MLEPGRRLTEKRLAGRRLGELRGMARLADEADDATHEVWELVFLLADDVGLLGLPGDLNTPSKKVMRNTPG